MENELKGYPEKKEITVTNVDNRARFYGDVDYGDIQNLGFNQAVDLFTQEILKRSAVERIEKALDLLEENICPKCEVYGDRTMCSCWLAKDKCPIDRIDNKTRAGIIQALFREGVE